MKIKGKVETKQKEYKIFKIRMSHAEWIQLPSSNLVSSVADHIKGGQRLVDFLELLEEAHREAKWGDE